MLTKILLVSYFACAASIMIKNYEDPYFLRHGDFPADATDAPTFFVKSEWARSDIMPGLNAHPSKVLDEASATLISVGPKFSCTAAKGYGALPKLPEGKSYLVWTNSLHTKCMGGGVAAFINRSDVTFVALDLRNHDLGNDKAKQLPGITMAPAFYHSGPSPDPSKPAKYHLTYRGQLRAGWQGSSSVRGDLNQAFEKYRSKNVTERPRQDVYVEMLPKDTSHTYSQADKDFFMDLTNTNFFINPHGDNRYMNNFASTLGQCAVPVVMADGLTLAFGELIDWSKAAVFLPESKAKEGAEAILAALPSDPQVIKAMRTEACRIHEKYFSTIERRIDAMLKSAAIRMKRKENAEDFTKDFVHNR